MQNFGERNGLDTEHTSGSKSESKVAREIVFDDM
jgi:hypothetical protein